MRIVDNPARVDWPLYTKRPVAEQSEIRQIVQPILDDVRLNGDIAIEKYTLKFDKAEIDSPEVSQQEIVQATSSIPEELKSAIDVAYKNIKTFHQSQRDESIKTETTSGITCWREAKAIDRIGLYIPGGNAPLFSTVMMLAIPAEIAGCGDIILCSPPDMNGKIHPAILYTATLCGVHRIFKVGGAQAIAALAYGSSSIPSVDKIFGPGNQYVTAAKQLVLQEGVAIDMPAGPSEVVVLADDSSDATFIAADLLAQAEHGIDSQVLLLTNSRMVADCVVEQVQSQLKLLPRKEIAEKAIENSLAIVFDDLDEALEFSNLYAPEHLIINTANYRELADKVTNAGSVFLGAWTPESLGDYASGTNHTLPTNGYARSYSGVSLDSFVKKITFQEATYEGLQNIGESVGILAQNENLVGHKRAVTIRLEQKK